MMSKLWVYEGELNKERAVLLLDSDGPDMRTAGKMAKYRDAIEFKSDDHRILTSHILGDDGAWHPFMTVNYHRKH
jgi:Protein of unknown function (DUF1579)